MMQKKKLQINGPFFTNYSYARVNRGLGLALSKIQDEYEVSLYGSKETIDFFPSEADLEKKPELKALFSEEHSNDVVIYNNFPKSSDSLHGLELLEGRTKIGYIAWEESIYPQMWVDEINKNLHGVMTISSFTKDVLIKSGVRIPITTVPIALDDELRRKATATYPLKSKKSFKFLHISTAKKRKGVDLLIKAYYSAFTKEDDVVLILKTTPNPDNTVDSLIKELKTENSPEIEIINSSDLSEQDLLNLHKTANCEVYPSRAEGFGLPILEAMFHEVAVITTGYSGQMDFCTEENSFLIDYKLDYTRDSEMVNLGAQWAEPSVDHMAKLMKYVHKNFDSDLVQNKVKNAKETADKYTWENTAKNSLQFINEISQITPLKERSLAVITPINDETGIANYSWDLYSQVMYSFKNLYFVANKDISDRTSPDDSNVVRLWETGETGFVDTLNFLKEKEIKIVHIQYHSGSFFSSDSLGYLISELKKLGIRTFLTFHAFRGSSFDYLKEIENLELVDRIFIHNPKDSTYAKSKLNNVEYFILPAREFTKRDKAKLREKIGIPRDTILVASHGLMNTNKNIPELIEATASLQSTNPNIAFLSINAVSSNNIHSSGIYDHCKELVKKLNLEKKVVFVPQFLGEEYIEIFLQISDIIVFNYTEVGESASGSVRKALASGNPVIVTDINMFSELDKEVLKIKDTKSETVAAAVQKILNDNDLREQLVTNARKFIEENLYGKKSLETLKIYLAKTT